MYQKKWLVPEPLAAGDKVRVLIDSAPELCPQIVILSGSPPKKEMYRLAQFRDSIISEIAKLPGIVSSLDVKNPRINEIREKIAEDLPNGPNL